jgi:hypothetical protein
MHTGRLSKTVFKFITLPYYSSYKGINKILLLTHSYVPLLQISVADTTTTDIGGRHNHRRYRWQTRPPQISVADTTTADIGGRHDHHRYRWQTRPPQSSPLR